MTPDQDRQRRGERDAAEEAVLEPAPGRDRLDRAGLGH